MPGKRACPVRRGEQGNRPAARPARRPAPTLRDPRASPEDVRLTGDAARAGELLGVELLDHVIVARAGFTSLRAAGLYTPRPAAGEAAERPRAGWTAEGADAPAPAGTDRGAAPIARTSTSYDCS